MEYQVLKPGDHGYPKRLTERLGADAPVLYYHGPLKLLDRFTLAVAASDLIPAQAMMAANQLLFTLRDYGINYIGGWHSVMETEIFRLALYRKNDPRYIRSLALFSARGLEHESWEGFLADRFGAKGPFTGFPEKEEYLRRAREGELLMLSITEPGVKRMTRENIIARNFIACALADAVFIPFAEKGTKTYTLCERVLKSGIPFFTAECAENKDLCDLGIQTFTRVNVGAFLEKLGASTAAESPYPPKSGPQPVSVAPLSTSVEVPVQMALLAKE
ncbi:MAG: hypothetical protein HY083_08500 [Gammaproteobacteria bacterium]|nr:hypothetical protein [Gammaproteobacteria bacterium]